MFTKPFDQKNLPLIIRCCASQFVRRRLTPAITPLPANSNTPVSRHHDYRPDGCLSDATMPRLYWQTWFCDSASTDMYVDGQNCPARQIVRVTH